MARNCQNCIWLFLENFHAMIGRGDLILKLWLRRLASQTCYLKELIECKELGFWNGLIGIEDAPHTFEYDSHYKILPAIHNWSSDPLRIKNGKSVPNDFTYSSDNNSDWMTVDELKIWIKNNKYKIGQI